MDQKIHLHDALRELDCDPHGLRALLKSREPEHTCLTLYLPVHQSPEQSDKNVTQLKSLAQQARTALARSGVDDEALGGYLDPLGEMIARPESLLRETGSIAFFVDGAAPALMDLPQWVEPDVYVDSRFHIKPVLAALQSEAVGYVLALAREDTRLYRCNGEPMEPVECEDLPRRLEDVVWPDDPEKQLQQHSGASISASGREGTSPEAVHHGQGNRKELDNEQTERFNAAVARAVSAFMKKHHGPLVVVGDEKNVGLVHKHCDIDERRFVPLHRNITDLSRNDLYNVVANSLLEAVDGERKRALETLRETPPGQRSEILEDVALAAFQGRVEMCVVAGDKRVPAICRPHEMRIEHLDTNGSTVNQPDLLESIAQESIQHGGKAYVTRADELPDGAVVSARFRY